MAAIGARRNESFQTADGARALRMLGVGSRMVNLLVNYSSGQHIQRAPLGTGPRREVKPLWRVGADRAAVRVQRSR
jgi:hypothetical protein